MSRAESRKLLIRAGVAALLTELLSIILVAFLQKIVGIRDSATMITLLLVPVLVFCVIYGELQLQQFKGPFGWVFTFQAQLRETRGKVEDLVLLSMSPSVFHHLVGVTILREYLYRQNEQAKDKDGNPVVKDGEPVDKDGKPVIGELFRREFYHLKNLGFIGPSTLEFDDRLHNHNIAGIATPTDLGWTYLRLRNADIINDEKCKRWLDPKLVDEKNRKMRDNLNIGAVLNLGLKLARDDTIYCPEAVTR